MPGMSPWLRKRRFEFFPLSVRLCAATTYSGISHSVLRAGHNSFLLDEQARDRSLLVDVSDGLGQELRDREEHDLVDSLLGSQGDRVGHDELREGAPRHPLDGVAGEHCVGAAGQHLPGSRRLDGLRDLREGPPGVHDVVHDEGGPAFDVADDVVHLRHVRLVAALVHDGQGRVEALGVGPRPLHPAGVGGDDRQVGQVQAHHVVHDDGSREQVIHRDVEEALDLGRVQVHGEDAVAARGREEVGHQLGRDGDPGLVLPVLARIAVVGHHRGEARGARALERVEHEQHLHQVLVHRRRGGLHHEDVGPAHVVLDLEPHLAVAQPGQMGAPQGNPQGPCDGLAERAVRASGEHLQLSAHSLATGLAGAEGFEPSNTGSKAPRLTTWPRPNCGLLQPPYPWEASLAAERLLPSSAPEEAGAADAAGDPTCCLYTPSTFSSRYCRIWLLSGCAMSLKVPSLRFLLGMETNKPLGPLMILMSVTTKHWSNTIDTNALSFSSSTGMTLTSVISMMSAPLVPSLAPASGPTTGTRPSGTGPVTPSAPGGP